MSQTKQLILVRKDLDMPVGKLAAQVSHASVLSFLNSCHNNVYENYFDYRVLKGSDLESWIDEDFTKVVLNVKNENQLLKYKNLADEKGLPNALITDLGRTCFNGQSTITCLGIGPCDNEVLDELFGKLQLYK